MSAHSVYLPLLWVLLNAVACRDDGILDAHHVLPQLDEVKQHYGCFFATAEAGNATVPTPAAAASPCE